MHIIPFPPACSSFSTPLSFYIKLLRSSNKEHLIPVTFDSGVATFLSSTAGSTPSTLRPPLPVFPKLNKLLVRYPSRRFSQSNKICLKTADPLVAHGVLPFSFHADCFLPLVSTLRNTSKALGKEKSTQRSCFAYFPVQQFPSNLVARLSFATRNSECEVDVLGVSRRATSKRWTGAGGVGRRECRYGEGRERVVLWERCVGEDEEGEEGAWHY